MTIRLGGIIVGLAISYSPSFSGTTLTAEQLCEIVALHDATGHVDYITVGYGSYLEFEGIIPAFTEGEKLTTPLTARLKAVVKHAVITSEAGVRTPDNAETILASGEADMVSIVRGQIADPHLARKVTEGRAEDIRGCISCNQMCWGRRSRDYWISCLINPSAGREWEWGGDRFTPAETPRHILIVGAGPAGCEAARAATADELAAKVAATWQGGPNRRLVVCTGGEPLLQLDAALVEFADRTYKAVSMERLAECAGLSKAGIYAHFKSKEEIFHALLERTTKQICDFQGWLPDEDLTLPELVDVYLDRLYATFSPPATMSIYRLLLAESDPDLHCICPAGRDVPSPSTPTWACTCAAGSPSHGASGCSIAAARGCCLRRRRCC